ISIDVSDAHSMKMKINASLSPHISISTDVTDAPHHGDEDESGLRHSPSEYNTKSIQHLKPNPKTRPMRPDASPFNIENVNNDSLNPSHFRSQTCPDIEIVPEFCP
ncbi:Gastrin/Cholecystokinin Type B Receptor, partial [Manis pentadactyla]